MVMVLTVYHNCSIHYYSPIHRAEFGHQSPSFCSLHTAMHQLSMLSAHAFGYGTPPESSTLPFSILYIA